MADLGLLLFVLRATRMMGVTLALLSGLVLARPYGKFVHAGRRAAVLLRSARERRERHS